MRAMIVYAAVLAAISALAVIARADEERAVLSAEEQKCFDAINAFRAEHKLPPLTLDPALSDGSRKWSMRMRQTRNFNHAGLTAKGVIGGENIAMGFPDGWTTFTQWRDSTKGHKEFMLSRTMTHAGVGNDGLYWTFRASRRNAETVKTTETVTETASNGNVKRTYSVTKKRKYVPFQPARNVLRTLFW